MIIGGYCVKSTLANCQRRPVNSWWWEKKANDTFNLGSPWRSGAVTDSLPTSSVHTLIAGN